MLLRKSSWGWILVILLSLSPLFPWLFVVQPLSDRFTNFNSTFVSIGELLGLFGTVMYCLSIVLSLRLKIFEDFFGGMNRVYIAHHIFGGVAFILVLLHPLALASSLIPYSLKSAALYLLPGNDWSINMGIAALLLTMGLLILTFFVKLPYEIWRLSHKFLGVVLFIGIIHGFFVTSDISRYPLMAWYMSVFFVVGMISYVYRTVFGKYFVRQYHYKVSSVQKMSHDTVEITLVPVKKKMSILPGQFVFLRFKSHVISNETHPFSVCSHAGEDALVFSIKAEGDYTNQLVKLEQNADAYLEGPFGRFLYEHAQYKTQIWVGGGIGITPFIGMAKELKPEFTVDLYYTVRTEQEALYIDELNALAIIHKNLRVIPFYSTTQGHLTAESILQQSQSVLKKDIYVCGPPPMMKTLRDGLRKLHVKNQNIHTEEFAMQ